MASDSYPIYYGKKLFPLKGICSVCKKNKGTVFRWQPLGLDQHMIAHEKCFYEVWAGER